jgi:glutamate racemase
VGVIGTTGTINSGAYERAIKAIAPGTEVVARACPLFVPLVEEGWLDTEATRLIAREYLEPMVHEHADTLVLGCTHYPLLKPLARGDSRRRRRAHRQRRGDGGGDGTRPP